MSNHRCDLCGLPMASEGATGFCSERCLMWDFFGVPALKENDLVAEIRQNQNGNPRQGRPDGYSDLFDADERKLISESLALLKLQCDALRDE